MDLRVNGVALRVLIVGALLVKATCQGTPENETSLGKAKSTPRTPGCEVPVEDESLPLFLSLPIIVFLVMLSGLFSGLTLGLMGLDLIGLETVENGDNVELSKCAAKIKPIRQKGNLLLCTLLLGNVAVNSALSI